MFSRKLRIEGLEIDFDGSAMAKIAEFVEMESATIAGIHHNEFTSKKYPKRDSIAKIYKGTEAGTVPVTINIHQGNSRYEIPGWVITTEIIDDQPLIS